MGSVFLLIDYDVKIRNVIVIANALPFIYVDIDIIDQRPQLYRF